MTNATMSIIRAAIQADSTIDNGHMEKILGAIEQRDSSAFPKVMTFKEAANAIHRSVARVRQLCYDGRLDEVIPKGHRAIGITHDSVVAYLKGER